MAGVKYGFVNVHTQPWTRVAVPAIAKAAEHRLMLDIHDEFRPTGMSRTYPNLLTQEGIRGNEEFPDATQGTILPFTRMLAGAGDHTFCWLDPRLKNTWGYQLAHAVVIYSPLQFLYWYDRPSAFTGESAGMEWFRNAADGVGRHQGARRPSRASSSPSRAARASSGSWGRSRTTTAGVLRVPLDMLRQGRRTRPRSTSMATGHATSASNSRTVRRGGRRSS